MIVKRLATQRVVIISLDSFYKALTPDQIEQAHASEYNFGTPSLFLSCTLTKITENPLLRFSFPRNIYLLLLQI